MPTRRALLRAGGATLAAGAAAASYAFWIEPAWRLRVVRHRVAPPNWPRDRSLTIAALSDIHAADPYMPRSRVARIVAATNALRPDMVVLLGDYEPSRRLKPWRVPPRELAATLAGLSAPYGVHAVLGNHDWWEDPEVQRSRMGTPRMAADFTTEGVPVLVNRARRVGPPGREVWVAGLGSLWAFRNRTGGFTGTADPHGTLGQVRGQEPVILLCHEPDIFPLVPPRVALTLCGHTHGGQVRLFGHSPIVPSRFGNRYAWGHVVEDGRHLVVSGGLGWTIAPVRFGVPPEITLITLGEA